MTTRRLVLSRSAALIGAASTGLLLPQIARAQSNKVRVGLMLPYTGTFGLIGAGIENGFRMALNEKNVPLWLETPLESLVVEKGRVVGACVRRRGQTMRIGARKGVLMAAGGFEQSGALRAAHLALPQPERSGGQTGNTGNDRAGH
jgi:outer membrane PBP1 activator LpoA protein